MTRLARCLSVWVRFSIGICQDRDPMPVSHDAFMFHGLRIFVCCATILVVLAKGLEYLKDVFQLNLYANCRNFHFHAILPIGSDDLKLEVMIFCDRLGCFGDKTLFLNGWVVLDRMRFRFLGHYKCLAFMVCFTICIFPISLLWITG